MSTRQCTFAPGFADTSFRLFELDEATLAELLRNDGRRVPFTHNLEWHSNLTFF